MFFGGTPEINLCRGRKLERVRQVKHPSRLWGRSWGWSSGHAALHQHGVNSDSAKTWISTPGTNLGAGEGPRDPPPAMKAGTSTWGLGFTAAEPPPQRPARAVTQLSRGTGWLLRPSNSFCSQEQPRGRCESPRLGSVAMDARGPKLCWRESPEAKPRACRQWNPSRAGLSPPARVLRFLLSLLTSFFL